MEDRAHTDKENMMKNIQQYPFMGFQTDVFRMTVMQSNLDAKAGVKLTNIVGPTMYANKSVTI